MQTTIETLKSKLEQGPQTRQIIAAFRSIEHRDFNYLLMVKIISTSITSNNPDMRRPYMIVWTSPKTEKDCREILTTLYCRSRP